MPPTQFFSLFALSIALSLSLSLSLSPPECQTGGGWAHSSWSTPWVTTSWTPLGCSSRPPGCSGSVAAASDSTWTRTSVRVQTRTPPPWRLSYCCAHWRLWLWAQSVCLWDAGFEHSAYTLRRSLDKSNILKAILCTPHILGCAYSTVECTRVSFQRMY